MNRILVSPFVSRAHMSMNLELLEPGSGVFHLRGTMNKSVPATIGPAPPRIVWQSVTNGLVIPSCIQIAHSTASHSPCCVLNLPWAVRAAGPFLSHGDVGSCNHQHPRDEVFGPQEAVVACKLLQPPRPCLHSTRVPVTVKKKVLSSDVRGACGAISAPSKPRGRAGH